MILRKSRYAAFAALTVAAGLCLPAMGRAQTDAPAAETQAENPPPKADEKISLQDVLAKARLTSPGIALAVGAENVTRNKKEIDGKDVRRINSAIEAFGMIKRDFGSVMAIGPQTYTELTTDFSKGNAFADMPPNEAFTLLLAGLNDGQRNALTSKAGLGLSDLTTPEQKQLFEALLPDEESNVQQHGVEEGASSISLGVLRDKAASVHFRMAQELESIFYRTAPDTIEMPAPIADAIKTPIYDWYYPKDDTKANGIVIRREVPNRLKGSNLNYNSPRLQVVIPFKDLTTVGELISRIAKRTGIELYADIRYEKQSLTWIVNGKGSASASDMLRAVAFCLPATYRRVGTAFVLTESLVGAGTRRKMIEDFADECEAERQVEVQKAKKLLQANPARKNTKLQSFDEPLALTPEQEKNSAPIYDSLDGDGFIQTQLSFDQLTPEQQNLIQKVASANSANSSPDLSEMFYLQNQLTVELLVPGINGVIRANSFYGALSSFCPAPAPAFPTKEAWETFLSRNQNLSKWKQAAKSYASRAVISPPPYDCRRRRGP